MESTTIYLIIAFTLGMVTLVILIGMPYLTLHLRQKQQRAQQLQQYRHTVSQYRLLKMLSFIGIGLDDYITRIPDEAIKQHITNCKACPNIPTCDRCLRDGEYICDMNFCPNYHSLMMFSQVMPSVEERL